MQIEATIVKILPHKATSEPTLNQNDRRPNLDGHRTCTVVQTAIPKAGHEC